MSAVSLLSLTPEGHVRHASHGADRTWTETNCYVDLWVEILNALGLVPEAAGAFALSAGFEGDQWTMFKHPPEDLRELFGIDAYELNAWRPVVDHVEEQFALGRLLNIEVDAWHLPDTQGVSYQRIHAKTSIVPNLLDRDNRILEYFHNSGYYRLEGDDFDGVFRLGAWSNPDALLPYIEVINLDRLRRPEPAELVDSARRLMVGHLRRIPPSNPVVLLGERIQKDLGWLQSSDPEMFHRYAFGTCRQCGASAEAAAGFLNWLARYDEAGASVLTQSAERLQSLSDSAKSLQFTLARAARGRNANLSDLIAAMAADWASGIDVLVAHYLR